MVGPLGCIFFVKMSSLCRPSFGSCLKGSERHLRQESKWGEASSVSSWRLLCLFLCLLSVQR